MLLMLRRFSAAAIVAAAAGPGVAVAATPTCRGNDVLAELAVSDPKAHRQILATASATPNSEALLWKIEKAGVAPSYLFGTIHMTDERVTTLSPKVKDAIATSRRVALEIADLSPAATAGVMSKAAPLFLSTTTPRLDAELTPDEFEKVKVALAKAGMPGQLASMIRPWLVHMLLAVSDCERQRSALGVPVVDMIVGALARQHGIEVVGLETLESQLQAMAAIPHADQIAMLKASLKFVDRSQDLMETMLRLYVDRRMGAAWPLNIAIAAQAGVPAAAYDSFESEVLLKRNERMRDRILPLLEEGAAFIGVGALHLIGKQGLVALVGAGGYTVTALE